MLKKIEKEFINKDLFKQAFTHKSWINENRGKWGSNERLEFLGDAILEFVVSKALYDKFPKKEEGYLTALRANLVNTKNLFVAAKELDLGKELLLSKGEEDGGGRENESLLADTMEALIGAIYMDRGIAAVRKFIEKVVLSGLSEKLKAPLKDAKSRLQEFVQSQGFSAPKYKVASQTGPDHSKKFVIEVLVNGEIKGKGIGKNKSEGAQKAAQDALVKCK